MLSAARYTDPYLTTYRPVPAAAPGVCEVCHSGPDTGRRRCPSCSRTMRQVSHPTSNVVPISLYRVPSQLRHVLQRYKDPAGKIAELFGLQVAAIIARFTARHAACIARLLGGAPTVVTSIPSTRPVPRSGAYPLEVAVKRARHLADSYAPLLVRGAAPVGHGQAGDGVFGVTRRLDGERVLLIDDTFTTGARVQSAASAFHRAGATAVAAVVVGRVIDPESNDNCRRIWDEALRTPFSFARCCRCHR